MLFGYDKDSRRSTQAGALKLARLDLHDLHDLNELLDMYALKDWLALHDLHDFKIDLKSLNQFH